MNLNESVDKAKDNEFNKKLNIVKEYNENKDELVIKVEGRLDTNAAVSMEDEIREDINSSLKKLTYDFGNLKYIASSGIRVLIASKKLMTQFGGELSIINAYGDVKEVFEMTGLIEALNVKVKNDK